MTDWLKTKKKALIIGVIVAAIAAITGAPPAALDIVVSSIYSALDSAPPATKTTETK